MNVLELFAGSRSIGKAAERHGHKVFSSDITQFGGIDYVVNILDFDYGKVPFVPDMIWSSPPCTAFSVAAIGKNWNKEDKSPKHPRAELGLQLVGRTLEIIQHYLKINPDLVWYMENPRGMLRKLPIVEGLHRKTVTYCTYGDMRMKPTDIWTNNVLWEPREMCHNGNPNCHHQRAPRGSATGTQGLKGNHERSKIPDELCDEIIMESQVEYLYKYK